VKRAAQPPKVERVKLGRAAVAKPGIAGLELVGPRLARVVQNALLATGGATSVAYTEDCTLTLRDWKAALPADTALAHFSEASLHSGIVLLVPSAIVASLVDRFYGGAGDAGTGHASMGPTEARMLGRIAASIADGIAAAWADVARLSFKPSACVFGSSDLHCGKDDDLVTVQRFVTKDARAEPGIIEIAYPTLALSALCERGTAMPSEAGSSEAWKVKLSEAVMQTRLPVRTVLARPTLPLAKLAALAPGDFIPVTLPSRVPVAVAGRLLAHGTIGETNGRAAIQIETILQGALFDD